MELKHRFQKPLTFNLNPPFRAGNFIGIIMSKTIHHTEYKAKLEEALELCNQNLQQVLTEARAYNQQYDSRLHFLISTLERQEKVVRTGLHQLLGMQVLQQRTVPSEIDWGIDYGFISPEDLSDIINRHIDFLALMIYGLLEVKVIILNTQSNTPLYNVDWETVNQARDDFYRQQNLLQKKGLIK